MIKRNNTLTSIVLGVAMGLSGCGYSNSQEGVDTLVEIPLERYLRRDMNEMAEYKGVINGTDKFSTSAPQGVIKKTSEYITDPWVRILTVIPSSALSNDILYITNNGYVLVGYNHEVYIPTSTNSGDCKTKREVTKNPGTLNLFINNQYVGSGYFSQAIEYHTYFSHNTDAIMKAVYTAEVQAKIKHYTKQKEYYWKNGVKKYRWVCEYDHTEYKTDTVTSQDILKTKIHNPRPN